jgi:predicted regulator of Ras-like GTPase activity (Roadblock/LC7/MglB family)
MSSVQTSPEYASRAARLDRILAELLKQTPGVEAAAVVSFDGLPMASALPADMDEDRVAAMSAALLSLAERASQDLNRGLLSQVYIEGEHGSVFLVSAKDEAVLIAVTASGAKVGMMLYEVKLAASKVGEALQGPVPLPSPLPSNLSRGFGVTTPAQDADNASKVAAAEDAAVEDAPIENAPIESAQIEDVAVEDAPIDDVAVEDVAPFAAEPIEPEPVVAEHVEAEPIAVEPEPVAADLAASEDVALEPSEPEPEPAYADFAQPEYSAAASLTADSWTAEDASSDDDIDYADSPLGSPLYDQVAFGHPERPDYFVAVPYSAADPADRASSTQGWYADQPWRTDDAAAEQHEYAPWEQPAGAAEPAATTADPAATENGWSSYAPSATVLPGEPTSWS